MGGSGEPGTEPAPKISALEAGVPMSGELPSKPCCTQQLFCCPRKCLQMLFANPQKQVPGRQGPRSWACNMKVAPELPPLCVPVTAQHGSWLEAPPVVALKPPRAVGASVSNGGETVSPAPLQWTRERELGQAGGCRALWAGSCCASLHSPSEGETS